MAEQLGQRRPQLEQRTPSLLLHAVALGAAARPQLRPPLSPNLSQDLEQFVPLVQSHDAEADEHPRGEVARLVQRVIENLAAVPRVRTAPVDRVRDVDGRGEHARQQGIFGAAEEVRVGDGDEDELTILSVG